MRAPGIGVGLLRPALGVVCLLFVLAFPSVATSTNADGKFVVVGRNLEARYPYGLDGLYVMNADGSGWRQITHSIFDEEPHWSPDGKWIAFVNTRGDPSHVEVVRDDGSGRRMLGPAGALGHVLDAPSPWSPDGARLAWSGCGGLCVMQLASSTPQRVSLGGDDSDGFAWSPDGRWLAAVDFDGHLVIVPAGGGSARVLSTEKALEPAWSPDGGSVAFVAQHGRRNFALEIVTTAGGIVRQLADDADRPRWSPDGAVLLYSGVRVPGVRSVDLATGHATVLAADGASPTWSPDGSGIAYMRARWPARSPGEDERDLWTASTDRSAARQVTFAFPTGVAYDEADWTVGSVTATPPTAPLLALPTLAVKQTGWVDALAPAPRGAIAYEDAGITCDPNAETSASVVSMWDPSATHVRITETTCGDYSGSRPFGVTERLLGWTSFVTLSTLEERPFAAFALQGSSQDDLLRLTADSYDKHIGQVAGIGDLIGDGSQLVFETWGLAARGKRVLIVHRRLWHIADRETPHAKGTRLPPDAGDALAIDAGRVVVAATRGLLLITADGRVLRRIDTAHVDSAQIGGALVGSLSGRTLSVYSTDQGRLRSKLQLAAAAGPPQLLSIRNGFAAYKSGIEIHVVRLQDASDHTLDLPGQAGPVDALLTSRGLFVSYNQTYEPRPGRVLYIPWSTLANDYDG
jgi:hypothetical protein